MLEIQFQDPDELEKAARQVKEGIEEFDDLEDFYNGLGLQAIKNTFTAIFHSEGAAGSQEPWPPLAASTLRTRKSRGYEGRKILHNTGKLRRSYTKTPQTRIVDNEMFIWSDVPYARYHELGTKRMPPRPVLKKAAIIGRLRLQRALNKYAREKFGDGTGT